MKTIEEIRKKIVDRDAVVYTAREFKQLVRDGEQPTVDEVDVVTCGTCGVMSGTAGVFSIPVGLPGSFSRAKRIWLNSVEGFPGPCPNERLGVVDAIVYGTSHAGTDYGGGHLFRDIVEGNDINVRVEAEGRTFENVINREDLEFARLFTTRSAYKNYTAFVNTQQSSVKTIFSVTGLLGSLKETSVSGCGEINPLENHPSPSSIDPGTKILVNGAEGYIMGLGTRSSSEKPNLSVFAEMKDMKARYMGGFVTSAGPECITSIAVPIPVLDEMVLASLCILDEAITLPIADISDRSVISKGNYAEVWQGTDTRISYHPERCLHCDTCSVAEHCPTHAISLAGGIDRSRCFNCGTCVQVCQGHAFAGELGALEVGEIQVPVTLRQSNRDRAEDLCRDLKNLILNQEFSLK